MRYAAVALSVAMGAIGLVDAQPETCSDGWFWDDPGRSCLVCTVCEGSQTVA
eukprot:COSAG02_NODE_48499_length_333_cov_0.880342_1_plen_51_part_10